MVPQDQTQAILNLSMIEHLQALNLTKRKATTDSKILGPVNKRLKRKIQDSI
jgi:hypothetical protein